MPLKNFLFAAAVLLTLNVTAADNVLTPQEKKEGWKLLFDGRTTKGWHSFGKTTFPEKGWIVKDGVLELIGGSKAGDIVTDELYSDFDLTWDWKIEPRGNNGVKYFVIDG